MTNKQYFLEEKRKALELFQTASIKMRPKYKKLYSERKVDDFDEVIRLRLEKLSTLSDDEIKVLFDKYFKNRSNDF